MLTALFGMGVHSTFFGPITAFWFLVMALGGTIAGGIGILFACCCTPVGLVLGVVGAVLGHMALSAMKSSGVTTSKELATAAVAAGWTAVGLNVVMAILGVILNLGSAFGGLDTIGS